MNSPPNPTVPHAEPSQIWWKESVIYQIYPSSFYDSNGDGIGDLNGIYEKLGYLKDVLGVDVLWLCPVYKSPMFDMGYDISDYYDIDPRYGTLEDWDRLVKGCKDRGMKLIMDLVVNHSSNEHPWFLESKSNKTNPKRDWYYWRPPRYDSEGNRHPPNNWRSLFAGSAWDYDATTGEYYLHLYAPQQPDLNWRSPSLRKAIFDMMTWWLERGCDGFRMDAISLLYKAEGLPDAPISNPNEEYQSAGMFYANQPQLHEYLKEMRTRVLSSHETLTIGQTKLANDLSSYVLPPQTELDLVFQFDLMHLSHQPKDAGGGQNPLIWHPWKMSEFKDIISRWQLYERDKGYWETIFLENHDYVRSVTRFGNTSTPILRTLSSKLLSMLQSTLSGTLFIYQGQEIGMQNVPKEWGIEEYKDGPSIAYYKRTLEERVKKSGVEADKVDMSDVMDNLSKKARDNARTPMQWSSEIYSGFSTTQPWMRVNDDYKEWNVGLQENDPQSILTFWREGLKLRKRYKDLLIYGLFEAIPVPHEYLFVYTRSTTKSSQKALVMLNLGEAELSYPIHESMRMEEWKDAWLLLDNYHNSMEERKSKVVLSDSLTKDAARDCIVLKAHQGLVWLFEQ